MLLFQSTLFLPALAVCLVLAGIHAYLGYHVVRRGVLFVDLALAQVAALGASVAVAGGIGDGRAGYAISLGFTLLGALLFALFRRVQERVPSEALIGITYAAAIALSLLVLERSATGTEEIKEMLVGSLFTVSWAKIASIAILYAGVGFLHWLCRRPLLRITENPTAARQEGLRIGWWDLFFYATFGLVVTSSVQVAGVLVVFALLVVPAVAALFVATSTGRRIAFAWGFAGIACLLALEASLRLDTAAGPMVVAVLVVLLVLAALVAWAWRSRCARPPTNADGPTSAFSARSVGRRREG